MWKWRDRRKDSDCKDLCDTDIHVLSQRKKILWWRSTSYFISLFGKGKTKSAVYLLEVNIEISNANATVTLLKQRPEKNSGFTGAALSQLSYQSPMRAVMCGLVLYVKVILGQSTWARVIDVHQYFFSSLCFGNFTAAFAFVISIYCINTRARLFKTPIKLTSDYG